MSVIAIVFIRLGEWIGILFDHLLLGVFLVPLLFFNLPALCVQKRGTHFFLCALSVAIGWRLLYLLGYGVSGSSSRYFLASSVLVTVLAVAGWPVIGRFLQRLMPELYRVSFRLLISLLLVGGFVAIGIGKAVRGRPRTFIREVAQYLAPSGSRIFLVDESAELGRIQSLVPEVDGKIIGRYPTSTFWFLLRDTVQEIQFGSQEIYLLVTLSSEDIKTFELGFRLEWGVFPWRAEKEWRDGEKTAVLYRFERSALGVGKNWSQRSASAEYRVKPGTNVHIDFKTLFPGSIAAGRTIRVKFPAGWRYDTFWEAPAALELFMEHSQWEAELLHPGGWPLMRYQLKFIPEDNLNVPSQPPPGLAELPFETLGEYIPTVSPLPPVIRASAAGWFLFPDQLRHDTSPVGWEFICEAAAGRQANGCFTLKAEEIPADGVAVKISCYFRGSLIQDIRTRILPWREQRQAGGQAVLFGDVRLCDGNTLAALPAQLGGRWHFLNNGSGAAVLGTSGRISYFGLNGRNRYHTESSWGALLGVSGQFDFRSFMERENSGVQPECVILLLGTEDILRAENTWSFFGALRNDFGSVCDEIARYAPKSRIIAVLPPLPPANQCHWAAFKAEYLSCLPKRRMAYLFYQALTEVAAEYPNVELVPLFAEWDESRFFHFLNEPGTGRALAGWEINAVGKAYIMQRIAEYLSSGPAIEKQ